MFAAPPVIETRVVGRLTPEMRIVGRTSGRYANRPFYLEGPAMARDGTLYFTDVPWGRIFQMTPDGEITLFFQYDGEPNGMKFHKDGRLFIADYSQGILWLDLETRRLEPYFVRIGNERLRGPNDLVFARNGDLYFTDQGNSDIVRPHGRVVRVRADGRSEILASGSPSPNGLALSPDEQWLYLAVTRTNAIWKLPLEVPPGLQPNEPVGTSGVFVQMSGGTGPDGMAVDSKGNIIVAHTGLGCAWMFTPMGEPLYRIQGCAGPSIANFTFGGPEYRTLYIVESATGSVLTAELPHPGETLFSHLA